VPSDFVIRTGDQATFNPTFGTALVVVQPGTITGSGRAGLEGPIACVVGDEATVVVPGVTYVAPPFATPGIGTLTIAALGADQIATVTKFLQKPAILKGTLFTARFSVTAPAINPNSGVPDPVPVYPGTGQFMSNNLKVRGS
jgi:hypothetical protein